MITRDSIQPISGVVPSLAVKADHLPARSETGIGALMPWADRLWFITYVAHKGGSGGRTGLFWVDDNLKLHKHDASVVGTYANRMIHHESHQCIIGPHLIDTMGEVRTCKDLIDIRITGTARHLHDPANKVYMLGMEGEFFEADVYSLEVTQLAELTEELGTSGKGDAHFKDIFTNNGRVVVCNNSYYSKDFADPTSCDGRLAEWDGQAWTVLEKNQFNTLAGHVKGELSKAIYAVGQDRASVIFKVFLPQTGWMTYRLPKATHTQDHAWTTEWPRIREVESERYMLNASGMFYELPAMTYADRVWGLRPVCSHLRIIGDYCSWNGLLVMAGDQTTPISDSNNVVGQPQANLWLGKTDDLWQWGPRQGWGGPWWDSEVKAGEPSDPYLMTGFSGGKSLHVEADRPCEVKIEIDVRGDGRFMAYESMLIGKHGAASYIFPHGFSCHWIRLVTDQDLQQATAQLHYA
jgi:hypothetical protein